MQIRPLVAELREARNFRHYRNLRAIPDMGADPHLRHTISNFGLNRDLQVIGTDLATSAIR